MAVSNAAIKGQIVNSRAEVLHHLLGLFEYPQKTATNLDFLEFFGLEKGHSCSNGPAYKPTVHPEVLVVRHSPHEPTLKADPVQNVSYRRSE